MSKIDREQLGELLSTYVDGELDAEQTELIERVLQEDAGARRLLDELRRTVRLVSSLPRHCAPGSIAEDVRFRVERSELLGGFEQTGAPAGVQRSPILTLLSIAAVLALVVGGLWVTTWHRPRGNEPAEGTVALTPKRKTEYAPGRLADAGTAAGLEERVRSAKRRHRGPEPAEAVATRDVAAKQPSVPTESTTPTQLDAGEKLIAMADFDQKLLAGMGAGAVRTHGFANETVQLEVTVRNEAERDAATARLLEYLSAGCISDLADVASSDSGRAAPAGSFYYRGKPGVNFSGAEERQFLVRASRGQLDGLMDELALATTGSERVALVAGPFSIQGFERIRTALQGLGEPVSAVAPARGRGAVRDRDAAPIDEREEAEPTPGRAFTGGQGLLEDLLTAMGLDPQMLSPLTKPASNAAPEESAAPATDVEDAVAQLTAPDEQQPRDAVAYAAGAGTDTVSETDAARANGAVGVHAEAKGTRERKGPVLEEPPSLVVRRVKSLEESRRRRLETPEAPTSPDEAGPAPVREGAAARVGPTFQSVERQARKPVPQTSVERQARKPVPQTSVERQARKPVPQTSVERQARKPVPQVLVEKQAREPVPQGAVEGPGGVPFPHVVAAERPPEAYVTLVVHLKVAKPVRSRPAARVGPSPGSQGGQRDASRPPAE